MFRKLVLVFLLVMACAPCAYAATYNINSYSEFVNIMQNNAILSTPGNIYRLGCDIQLSGASDWEPAGTLDSPFRGYFDGQGHTIYINIQPLPVVFGEYLKLTYDRSLFGVVSSDSTAIENLNVEGIVRGYNAGGLVSVLLGGTISNCAFSGDVTAETSPAGDEAMGYTIDEIADDNITDANGVEAADDLEEDPKTKEYGKINAGGIAAVMLNGEIDGCSFRGNVTASADETSASAGGIAGKMIRNSTNISGCYVEGDSVITASTAANGQGVLAAAGGIAGYANTQLDSTIDSCIVDGIVSSTYYAGGIAGEVHGTILSANTVSKTASVSAAYSAGGIAGYMTSGASAKNNTVESGAVVAAETYSAGGIIGRLVTSGKAVENNASYASIGGTAPYQGGIVGALDNSTSSAAAIGAGNTYSGAEYGIGRDEWGNSTNGLSADNTPLIVQSGDASYEISPESLNPALLGAEYMASFDVSGSSGKALTWSYSGTLPDGLTFSTLNGRGILSGTPTETGSFTFTVSVSVGGLSWSRQYTLVVSDAGFHITTGSVLQIGTEGKSYTQLLSADIQSYSGVQVWYIDSGDIPPGLNISRSTGTISGTPTKAGTYSFRVRLLIGNQITAKNFTILIIPGIYISVDRNITSVDTLPDAKEGSSYDCTLTASADNVIWSHTAGIFPPGLTLAASGRISGIPTKADTYTFTVRAEDTTESLKAERTFTLTVKPVLSILTEEALPRAKTDVWYSETLSADAPAIYAIDWKLLDGALPEGLYLNSSTGNISGTPAANTEGTYTFTIQATAGSYIYAKKFTLIVGPVLEILNDTPLGTGKVGRFYLCEISADSEFPVSWALSDGIVPYGLTFSDGRLSGTPTAEGTYTFTISAESGGLTASKTFTLVISPVLSITTPEILPSVKARSYYSYTLSSDADDPSSVLWSTNYYYSYTYAYNTLPSGMYIDEETGTIYGTPTAEGTYTFTVRAVMGSVSTSKEFTLTVRPMLSIETESPLPHAEVNEKYSVTLLTDADEDQTVVWSVIEGTLPDRLILDKDTGELSGYPLSEGTYSFTIQAFSSGLTAQKRFELTAGEVMSIIVSQTDPIVEAGEKFSLALLTDKTNGKNAVWSVIDGIIPPGLNLDSQTGVISGTPSRAGKYTFVVQALSGYSVAQKELSLMVNFTISSEWILPDGAVGENYSYRFTAKGVSASSVLWTVSSDSVLPEGLTLATNGILSGTTSKSGTYTFMVYAFVSNDVSAMQTVRLKVTSDPEQPVPILTVSLPDGQVSQDYYAELRAGIEGVAWRVLSGKFPPGLTLTEEGVISGTPTEAASDDEPFTFTVLAYTDTQEGTRQFTITIESVPVQKYVSGGGGGCDSGIGVIGLAVLGLIFRRHGR